MSIRNVYLAGDSTTAGNVGGYNRAAGGSGSWPEIIGRLYDTYAGPLLGSGFRHVTFGSITTYNSVATSAGPTEWSATASTWEMTGGGNPWDVSPHGQALANGPFLLDGVTTNPNPSAVLKYTIPPESSAAAGFAIYWIDRAGEGNWRYRIDGGSWVNMGETRAATNRLCKFYVPTAATKTIEISANNGTSACQTTISGIETYKLDPRTNNGVIVHNLGRNSYWAFAETVTSGGADRLAIYDNVLLGTNAVSNDATDLVFGYTNDWRFAFMNPATYQATIQTVFSRLMPKGVNCWVINMFEQGFTATAGWTYLDYRNAGKAAAANMKAGILDIDDAWKKDYGTGGIDTYAAAGLINPGTWNGGPSDGLHQSDLGHADIARRVWFGCNGQRGICPVPGGPEINGVTTQGSYATQGHVSKVKTGTLG